MTHNPQQCKYCGILNSKKTPVTNYVCARCRIRKREFPKLVKCARCGKEMMMEFPEWSRRGNYCIPCDVYFTRLVRENGYPTEPENRKTFIAKMDKKRAEGR